jgi:hypothetical protein
MRQELFLKNMQKLGLKESVALSSKFQKLCLLIFLPGFASALMLFGIVLIPFGFVNNDSVHLIAGAATLGFIWIFLVAPYLCREYVEPYMHLRSEYLGRYSRANSYAYVCEKQKLFFIWRQQYFFDLDNIFRSRCN